MKRKALTGMVLLLAGTGVSALAAENAAGCATPPAMQMVEHFLSADCLACWQAPEKDRAATPALRLDWILPAASGDDAPLAVAALPEAGSRAKSPPPTGQTLTRLHTLVKADGAALEVDSGLAWNNYLGLSFDLTLPRTPWADDAEGWVALVERVPAGEDGTATARQLVRALVGPLTLAPRDGLREVHHLNAIRLPANSRPERLGAVGWVERADGTVLLAAQSLPAGCR